MEESKAASLAWVARRRNYAKERQLLAIPVTVPDKHPLDDEGLAYARSKLSRQSGAGRADGAASARDAGADDPLGAVASADEDPLRAAAGSRAAAAAAAAGASSGPAGSHVVGADDGRASHSGLNWPTTRQRILRKYVVDGSITLSRKLFDDAAKMDAPADRAMSLEEAKERLARLDEAAEPTTELTQRTYQQHIERLHASLESAWASEKRVLALKIAIKTSKLIARPTSMPAFYPSAFAMCSGILDSFGRKVFERLRGIADADSRRMGTGALPADFTAADVGSATRETTRNWLYKTACIRELVPRLYMELALLECYRFLGGEDYAALLTRLAHTCRGVGDPLVAAYARFYLAKQAARLVAGEPERACVWLCLSDQLATWGLTTDEHRVALLGRLGVSQEQYADLFAPPLAWLCQQVAWKAPSKMFSRVIRAFRASCGSPVALTAILSAFDGRDYGPHLADIVPLIKAAAEQPTQLPPADMYRALAEGLVDFPPPAADRMPFLRDAWTAVSAVEDAELFAECAAPFVELLCRHYEREHLIVVLRVVAKRMRKAAKEAAEAAGVPGDAEGGGAESGAGDAAGAGAGPGASAAAAAAAGGAGDTGSASAAAAARRVPVGCLSHLERILVCLVSGPSGSGGDSAASGDGDEGPDPAVITSDAFVSLMDLFSGARKTDVCRRMLEGFVKAGKPTSDPVLVHTLMDMARALHDGLDRSSPAPELARASFLCGRLIELTDFGRDLERQLALLTEARQSFRLLEGAKRRVCLAGLRLTRRALRLVKGRHGARTAPFMRACFAFMHITTPGLASARHRLNIYCAAAESALCNDCAPQADALLAAAVAEVSSVAAPPSTDDHELDTKGETFAEEAVRRVAGSLVMAPGHPEAGPFHHVRSLAEQVRLLAWDPLSSARVRCIMAIADVLGCMGQRELPYRPPAGGAEANDTLYAGDPDYEDELQDLYAATMEEALGAVSVLSDVAKDADDAGSVGEAFRDALMTVIDGLCAHAELSVPEAAATLAKLLKLAKRRGVAEGRLQSLARRLEERAAAAAEEAETGGKQAAAQSEALSRLANGAAVLSGLRQQAWRPADGAAEAE
ncbi:hypothetical protein FNF27_01496 [Cafeteria roenbergensis]|uniref:Uncharacterized protein n=1 Tax=Cafeteria roenbergensis TaxID=33653 RepID=A0A5A8EH09_CAFRO|nr:hypothetical protein FNF27_01496 [Cafeteria roenbergensis]